MKIVAIISEYNPFHMGHEYQVNKLRELLGEDTAVVAIMSGNFTQRGEFAVADKTIRARAAVDCGVNLVLELPFPFSMTSAEFFAKSGVKIATEIGADYLAFGSESGDLSELSNIVSVISSKEYAMTLDSLSSDKVYKDSGYPELCQIALSKIYGREIDRSFFSPNNILAIEYLRAVSDSDSSISPITIRREGSGYFDIINPMASFQSASAIRKELESGDSSALDYVPNNGKLVFLNAIEGGKMPSDSSLLDYSVISFFRLNSPTADLDIQDASGGLYNRLCDSCAEATSIISLTATAETKKYTKARIRRAIWNCFFGVTSSEVRALPSYTQVLAMDKIGRSILKRLKKESSFPIITKPSAYKDYGEDVIRQAELSHRADSVYGLTLPKPYSGRFPLTFTPYVKD